MRTYIRNNKGVFLSQPNESRNVEKIAAPNLERGIVTDTIVHVAHLATDTAVVLAVKQGYERLTGGKNKKDDD
jgi:hypothetical protein